MRSITTLLMLFSLAAAPATVPSTRIAPQRADVAAPKLSATTRIVERFHSMHDKFVQQAKSGGVDVLFLGDSITEGWAGNGKELWKERYAKLNAANFGISGDRTQHVLWRLENGELDGIKPKVVMLMIGTNNIGSNPPEQIAAGVNKLVDKLRENGSKVLLLGIFPRGENAEKAAAPRAAVAKVNETIKTLEDGQNIRYLDLADKFMQPDGTLPKELMPDFLHLSAKGYAIWADAIDPVLAEMLQ